MLGEIIDEMYHDKVHPMHIWEFIFKNTDCVDVKNISKTFCSNVNHYTDLSVYLRQYYTKDDKISDFDDWVDGDFENHQSDTLFRLLVNALESYEDHI